MFVQAKTKERQEARRLRAEGMSVKRIAAALGVAPSSVSVWVRDIATRQEPVKMRTAGRPMGPVTDAIEEVGAEGARRCSRCERTLPLAAFNRSGDGHEHWCRTCFRSYFKERGQHHREQSRVAQHRRREAARAFIEVHLREHPCADCGEDEVLVLEFDHVRGEKRANVSTMVAKGWKLSAVRDEVAGCDVVCVNCHRRRTARRAGYYRFTGIPSEQWTAAQRRNQLHILEVLRCEGCIDCGERDPVVLEFDHRLDKRACVLRLALRCSLAVLEQEIAKCDVRCANCHRLRTLTEKPCWRAIDHWADGLHDQSADAPHEDPNPLVRSD